jgi:cation diffusion facilitator CzcD-associated flavoprotein CzcO
MTEERFGVPPRNHVPGTVIHEYLEAYAKEFGIFEHVRFNTKVFSAEHLPEGGWILETAGPEGTSKVSTHKLIVATGLTSEPIMPHIKGQEDFDRPLFHIKDFRKHEETIKTAKRVTVFGGTKSAWDAVYAYGTRGIPVDWIIRRKYHSAFPESLRVANLQHSDWTRPLLDVASICDAIEEMAGEACQ